MDGFLWILIGLPLVGGIVYFIDLLIHKRYPEVNLRLVAFGAGILIWIYLKILCKYLHDIVLIGLVFSGINIFIGWLLTVGWAIRGIRDFLGSPVYHAGTHITEDHKPTYSVIGVGMGKALQYSMDIKSRKALHGLLSSFFAAFLIFLYWVLLTEQTNFMYLIAGFIAVFYFALLGWIGGLLGELMRRADRSEKYVRP